MLKICFAFMLAATGNLATNHGPILWDKVAEGMSIEEVRALYPQQAGKVKWHKNQVEIEDVSILEGCSAEVEIQHKTGIVDAVKIKGRGSLGGRCSDKVLNALSAPFGGRCLDLANLKFEEMFLWLSGSLSRVSQSSPGERVQLVDPAKGDDLSDGWVL